MDATNTRWLRDMLTYFFFTLPAAAAPIVFLYAKKLQGGAALTRGDLVADGGLFTFLVGINAGVIARLAWSGTKWLGLKIAFCGLSCFAVILGSYFYAIRDYYRSPNSVGFVDLCLLVSIVSIGIAIFSRFFPEDYQ